MVNDRIIINGDCLEVLKTLPSEIIDTCITSPPYYALRDYGNPKQIGLEDTPEEYIEKLVAVFSEVKRVLKKDGTLWVNIGDSYATSSLNNSYGGEKQRTNKGSYTVNKKVNKLSNCKPKDLIGIPWLLAFALRADRWYLRQDIIWQKPNPMPESVKDRCTRSHEYIFLLSKNKQYYFDNEAIQESAICAEDKRKGARLEYEGKRSDSKDEHIQKSFISISDYRNKRDVWTVPVKAVKAAHFATYPEELIEPCILAGSRKGAIVLDPFSGSGTTGRVAIKNGRKYIGIELNEEYININEERINNIQTKLF